jgi:predicted ester cyclase
MPAAPSLALRLLDQAFNHGNLAILDELVSVDAASHIAGWDVPVNRLGLKQMIVTLRAAFPDIDCTIEDEIDGGDKLAARWAMRGTHRGSLFGNRPTGRQIKVPGFIFAHTAGGRIIEEWILIDQVAMLQQLGIIPPPRDKR